ncbi:MAG: hypothetical protein NTU53_05310 [Planctomycetota bacterium]|nr:hypothetical protein [Planctomycetota bacterium]
MRLRVSGSVCRSFFRACRPRSRSLGIKKYIVRLDAEERARLEQLIGVGKAAAYRIRHANVLLAVDESDAGPKRKDVDAARAFNVGVRSIELLRKRLVEEGLDAFPDARRIAGAELSTNAMMCDFPRPRCPRKTRGRPYAPVDTSARARWTSLVGKVMRSGSVGPSLPSPGTPGDHLSTRPDGV